MADRIVDRVENVRLLENEIVLLLDKFGDSFNQNKIYIKLVTRTSKTFCRTC